MAAKAVSLAKSRKVSFIKGQNPQCSGGAYMQCNAIETREFCSRQALLVWRGRVQVGFEESDIVQHFVISSFLCFISLFSINCFFHMFCFSISVFVFLTPQFCKINENARGKPCHLILVLQFSPQKAKFCKINQDARRMQWGEPCHPILIQYSSILVLLYFCISHPFILQD